MPVMPMPVWPKPKPRPRPIAYQGGGATCDCKVDESTYCQGVGWTTLPTRDCSAPPSYPPLTPCIPTDSTGGPPPPGP